MPILRQAASVSGWSQDKQRLPGRFHDQHRSSLFPEGRPWIGMLERPALQDGGIETAALPMPIGDLNADGWEAPWYPEQKYFKYAQGGTILEFRLKIDYPAMKGDYTAATRAYYERAVKEAAALKILPLPVFGAVIPWELEQVVGPAPRSPKIPEAAMTGDQWLLGFSEEENEELARYLQMGTQWVPTPEQSVRGADELATMKAELRELRALLQLQAAVSSKRGASPEHMQRMREMRKPTKPARKPTTPANAQAGA